MFNTSTLRAPSIIALALSAIGCTVSAGESEPDVGEVSEALAEGPVTVVRAAKFVMSKYGMTSVNHSYTVLVDDLAYDKAVTIWGETPSGWQGLAAQYVRSAGDRELWEAHTNGGFDRFAVKYEVDGQTYWDNNGGQDYTVEGSGVNLYNGVDVLQWGTAALYGSSSYLFLGANLRNLSYDKDVDVVYTTDGWATVRTAPLYYDSWQVYGYGSAPSPNDAGIEYWTGAVEVGSTATEVEYAFAYEVGEQTYWDNNFGANYVVQRSP